MKKISKATAVLLLGLMTVNCGENKSEIQKSKLLKEITSYSENPYTKAGYENIKTYYYGVYIDLPKDTTGVANQVLSFLKEKSGNVEKNEVIHAWVFTDSTIIPKSFRGNWGTKENEEKCFAHAAILATGNYTYDYNILGEFKNK